MITVKYMPSWLPGAGFKRKAKQYAAVVRDLVEIPYDWAKAQWVRVTMVHMDAFFIEYHEDYWCCFTVVHYPPVKRVQSHGRIRGQREMGSYDFVSRFVSHYHDIIC